MIDTWIDRFKYGIRNSPGFIFVALSSSIFFALLLIFPFYDIILRYLPPISNFSDHIMSEASASNLNITTRINLYLLLLFGFLLLIGIIFSFLLIKFNNHYKEEFDDRIKELIRDSSLIGIAAIVASMLAASKDLAVYFIGVAVLLGWIFLSLKNDKKDFDMLIWSFLISIPLAIFVSQFFAYLGFTNKVSQQIALIVSNFINYSEFLSTFSQQISQLTMLGIFVSVWALISVIFIIILPMINYLFKLKNKEINNIKPAIIICGIPILFTGIIQSLLLEFLNIINKDFSIVFSHPYLMYIVVMCFAFIISLSLFIVLKSRKIYSSNSGDLIYKLYLPIILLTAALIWVQPSRMISAGNEFYEMANHGLSVDQFFRYGSIPIIQSFDAHMLSNEIFAYIYSFLNGYQPWAAFLYNNYSWLLYIIPLFYILRKLIGQINSFLIILCFPLLTNLINSYFLLSGLAAICIIHMISSRKLTDYYLFWITAFLLIIYRIDLGVAALLGGIATYFISCFTFKEKADITKLFSSGGIITCILLILFVLLCILKGVNPVDRSIEFIKICMSNQTWAYTSVGNPDMLAYIIGYYILPLFVIVVAFWMITKYAILNRDENNAFSESKTNLINKDAFIMFIFFTAFFVFNIERGIVRHSFAANTITFILGTIPLALLSLSIIIKKSNNMLRFLSVSLAIIILINVNIPSYQGMGSSLLLNAISSPSYQEQYTSAYSFNGTRIKGLSMPADAETLKRVLDTVLTPQETYFDFDASVDYYYALVGRENPVYVNQPPIMISDDSTQNYALQEIKKIKPPIVLMPVEGKAWQTNIDGIAVDYKYYMIAEYIYENYEPLIRLPRFDIYCLKERRDAYINKLTENGLISKLGLQIIDDQPEIWVYDLGQIPRLWAEKDGNKVFSMAPSLKVQETDVSAFTTDTSNIPSNEPMYLLLQLNSAMDATAMVDIRNSQNNLAEYKFVISKGNHSYVIRLSTDYHWWNNVMKYVSVVINQPVSINKFCFVSAESSTYYNAPLLDAGKLALVEGTTLFSVDSINGRALNQQTSPVVINAQTEKTITISGWAVDEKTRTLAGGIFINVDGKEDILASDGIDRPDVAEFFKNSNYSYSGFLASFPTSILTKGQHILTLKIVTVDRKGYYAPQQQIILDIQ